MKCEQCKESQMAWLLKELTETERETIEVHKQECDSCRHEYASISDVWHTLDEQGDRQPSPHLRENFQSMLDAELALGNSSPENSLNHRRLFEFIWPSKPAWAFSYSFALLFGGLLMGNMLPQSPLWSHQNEASSFAQFDYSSIPEDRLIQICSVQNSPHFETL